MAQRKIRLSMSSHLKDGVGAIVDIDFNGENLDVDLEIDAAEGVGTVVKEYTVDVAAGTYNLDIDYKNDAAELVGGGVAEDRNLVIEKVEIADDGINYQPFIITENNCNADRVLPYSYQRKPNPDHDPAGAVDEFGEYAEDNDPNLINPAFNADDTRTDAGHAGFDFTYPGGSNPKYIYPIDLIEINPSYKYMNGTVTINLTFT